MERKIIEASQVSRMPLPPKIANAPVLLQGLSLFYNAFFDLTTCRQKTEYSEGPIPWLAINEYCKHHGIQGEQREDMETIIGEMDAAYIVWAREARLRAIKKG